MKRFTQYQKRPVRFLTIEQYGEWKIKVYSISAKSEYAGNAWIALAKGAIPEWLNYVELTDLPSYQLATLIIHETRAGCYAIISWWTDENMLQLFAYFSGTENTGRFRLVSDSGLISCVWEMAVLWFERNAWVTYVLKQPDNPDAFKYYLQQQLNEDI